MWPYLAISLWIDRVPSASSVVIVSVTVFVIVVGERYNAKIRIIAPITTKTMPCPILLSLNVPMLGILKDISAGEVTPRKARMIPINAMIPPNTVTTINRQDAPFDGSVLIAAHTIFKSIRKI